MSHERAPSGPLDRRRYGGWPRRARGPGHRWGRPAVAPRRSPHEGRLQPDGEHRRHLGARRGVLDRRGAALSGLGRGPRQRPDRGDDGALGDLPAERRQRDSAIPAAGPRPRPGPPAGVPRERRRRARPRAALRADRPAARRRAGGRGRGAGPRRRLRDRDRPLGGLQHPGRRPDRAPPRVVGPCGERGLRSAEARRAPPPGGGGSGLRHLPELGAPHDRPDRPGDRAPVPIRGPRPPRRARRPSAPPSAAPGSCGSWCRTTGPRPWPSSPPPRCPCSCSRCSAAGRPPTSPSPTSSSARSTCWRRTRAPP